MVGTEMGCRVTVGGGYCRQLFLYLKINTLSSS